MRRLWQLCWVSLVCLGCLSGASSLGLCATLEAQQGYRFPAVKVRYTQYKKRWRMFIHSFNFTKIVGKRPFVLLYFLPGHTPSELELKALDAFQKKWKDRLDCLAIAPIRRHRDIKEVLKRLKVLKVDLPVLLDEKKQLSYLTLTRQVPSYTAVSAAGYLRLTNAASLTELVGPGLTLVQYLAQLAKGQTMPLVRAPGFSPNPYQWIGKKMAAFQARALGETAAVSLETLRKAAKQKPLLFVFWSVSCSHCQRLIKQLDVMLNQQKQKFDLVSLVHVGRPQELIDAKEFARQHKLQLPILLAPSKLFTRYHAQTLPMLMITDVAGTIRAVSLGVRGSLTHVLGAMVASAS